jgi:hypothetical protein
MRIRGRTLKNIRMASAPPSRGEIAEAAWTALTAGGIRDMSPPSMRTIVRDVALRLYLTNDRS